MIGDIRKFRFWCQKVLPLVYDDSLSYYEVLCKVVQYLNGLIDDVNKIPEYIDSKIEEALTDEHIIELLSQFITKIQSAISANNEGTNTNSNKDYNIGQMLWLNDTLYRVIRPIDAGATFIVDTNIEAVNFEDLFNDFIDEVKHDISANDDRSNTIATQSWTAGTWLWLNDVLYKVKTDITQGNAYVFTGDNANVEEITVEGEIKKEATARANADTVLQGVINGAINEVNEAIGNLEDLETEDKENLVDAINELNGNIGVLSNLTTDNKTNLVLAINELDSNFKSVFVTPEMFGAVGDGVTDDSAAIEAASAVGCVYGGDHEYYVGTSIDIVNPMMCGKYKVAPNASIAFKKNDSFLYNVDFSNSAYPSEASDRGNWMLDVYHCKNVEVDGCAFHDGCNALYIDRGENISVNNCTFQDLKQTAANYGGNGYGVLTVQCKDVTISNCKFIDVARHAIYLSHDPETSDYNDGIVISNNLFRWTSNVSGNTTGFEVTMMIRPSINVLIEGNIFDNVYCIADLYRQRILYNGVLTVKACHNISIKNNTGYFEFKNRDDGVVYLDGASTNSYESHSNIVIEGNDFRVKGTSFIKLANCNGLYIKNNRITMLSGGAYRPLIYNEIPADYMDIVKDIIIEGNVIEGESVDGNPIMYFVYGSSSNPKNHGKLIIANNTITKCMYMFVFTGDNARAFELLDICNNNIEFIKSTLNTNNMHDSAITTLKLKNNSFNDIVRLRCATPTNVSSLDSPFTANGLLTAPNDGVVGSLYNNSTALQLRKPDGTWFTFT